MWMRRLQRESGLPGIAQSKKVKIQGAYGPVGAGCDTIMAGSRYFNKVARYPLNFHPLLHFAKPQIGGCKNVWEIARNAADMDAALAHARKPRARSRINPVA